MSTFTIADLQVVFDEASGATGVTLDENLLDEPEAARVKAAS